MSSASVMQSLASTALRYRRYTIYATLVLGALLVFSQFAGQLPTVAVGIIWAALTIVAAGGTAYTFMASKLKNRKTQRSTGYLFRFFKGGTIRFILAFIVSAICVACLMLSAARWGTVDWIIAVAGAAICPFIFNLSKLICHHEFESIHETSRALVLGNVLLALILSAVAFLFAYLGPAVHYRGIIDAYLAQPQPFEHSASALLRDAGMYYSFFDTLKAYGISQIADMSLDAYAAGTLALAFGSWCGFSLLLCTCMMPFERIREVFLPLDRLEQANDNQRVRPRLVLIAFAAALPIATVLGFSAADERYVEAQQTQEYTNAQQFVREQIGFAAYAYDGKFYDQGVAEVVLADIADKSNELNSRIDNSLIPLINATFDKQIDNIDTYLDWYYSLPADYERLIGTFTGTIESGIEDKLTSTISEGVDQDAINEELSACCDMASALETEFNERMSACEVADIPDWLIVPQQIDVQRLKKTLEPSQELLDDNQRFIGSVAGGTIGAVIAKKCVDRVLEKQAVKSMAEKLAQSLGLRGASSAIGAAAGSVVPAAGTAVGIAAGTAASIAIDFALLKADEAMNRQTYHDEIAEAINQARADTLAMLPQTGDFSNTN